MLFEHVDVWISRTRLAGQLLANRILPLSASVGLLVVRMMFVCSTVCVKVRA